MGLRPRRINDNPGLPESSLELWFARRCPGPFLIEHGLHTVPPAWF